MPRKQTTPSWERVEASGPALLMYSKNWMEGTRSLTLAEKGLYIDLLQLMSMADGPIENDPSAIAKACGVDTRTVKATMRRLVEMGKIVIREGNSLTNGRCFDEIEKRKARVEKQRAGGARGGRPRKSEGGDQGLDQGLDQPRSRNLKVLPADTQPADNKEEAKKLRDEIGRDQKPKGKRERKSLGDTSLRSVSPCATPLCDDAPEESREERCLRRAVERYNSAASLHGWRLAQWPIQRADGPLATQLRARLKDCRSMTAWMAAIDRMEASAWCSGEKTIHGEKNGVWQMLAKQGLGWITKLAKWRQLMNGEWDLPRAAMRAIDGSGKRGGRDGEDTNPIDRALAELGGATESDKPLGGAYADGVTIDITPTYADATRTDGCGPPMGQGDSRRAVGSR